MPLCGATTSSHAHEPSAGVVPCMPPEMALTKASAVDTSPYAPASGTSRRSTQGWFVSERDTTKRRARQREAAHEQADLHRARAQVAPADGQPEQQVGEPGQRTGSSP